VLFAGGLFRSMQFTSLNTVGFADIRKSQLSGASTLSSMIQQMTIGMGIAVAAIALRLAGALHSTNAGFADRGRFPHRFCSRRGDRSCCRNRFFQSCFRCRR
jgi:hypothetical protein